MIKTKRHNKKSIVKNKPVKSCMNNPVPVPFEVEGFKGVKCDNCLEVLEYESTGENLNED